MTQQDLKCGDFLQTKTGEIMQVNSVGKKKFQFQMYHMQTKERSDFVLEGETTKLNEFLTEMGVQKIPPPQPQAAT